MERLDIVVPAYNEENNIPLLIEQLQMVFASHAIDWQVCFVDDGSKDQTWVIIQRMASQNPRIHGLRLSRNFGHQSGILAGMEWSTGDYVLSMDCDLQHPPEVIPCMLEKIRQGHDIVVATRQEQKVTYFKKYTSDFFYRLFNVLADTRLAPNAADFRLVSRKVRDGLLRLEERDMFLRGMVSWIGYDIGYVTYDQPDRQHGSSSYTLQKMLRLAKNGIVSFSSRPLYIAFLLGIAFILASLAYGFFILMAFLMHLPMGKGWPSLILFVMASSGIQLLCIGILSVYVASIYKEVKHRPHYMVRDKTDK